METQKRMRVSSKHWELLLQLLEEHPEMVTGKFVCQNAKQRSTQLWQDAATKLNALGLGVKTPDKWKLALQDWKYKTKLKVAEIKEHEKKTGGGPPIKIKLNDQEERLMNIIGWTAALGNESVPESGLGMQAQLKGHEADSVAGSSSAPESVAGPSSAPESVAGPSSAPDFQLMDSEDVEEAQEEMSVPDGLAAFNKRQKKGTSTKRKSSGDPLETYQTETMGVLKDISDGIKDINATLKSISESLATLAKKSDDDFSLR